MIDLCMTVYLTARLAPRRAGSICPRCQGDRASIATAIRSNYPKEATQVKLNNMPHYRPMLTNPKVLFHVVPVGPPHHYTDLLHLRSLNTCHFALTGTGAALAAVESGTASSKIPKTGTGCRAIRS